MDHYATDAAAVVEHLDLRNAIHVSHSTGGGEAVRDVGPFCGYNRPAPKHRKRSSGIGGARV